MKNVPHSLRHLNIYSRFGRYGIVWGVCGCICLCWKKYITRVDFEGKSLVPFLFAVFALCLWFRYKLPTSCFSHYAHQLMSCCFLHWDSSLSQYKEETWYLFAVHRDMTAVVGEPNLTNRDTGTKTLMYHRQKEAVLGSPVGTLTGSKVEFIFLQ